MNTKTRPKAPEKARGAANLQSSQKISISHSRACETKLGCVLSFLEKAIRINWRLGSAFEIHLKGEIVELHKFIRIERLDC